ncbi:hypothetical protein PILCRDRAFT_824851 [Piloderma croceum F 1598]|uniref:C2 domain-containing protein n=1 Tax=Piloderma croceum (strain F 1598) TaxID=765440 RepID=A0A0C3F043_PILCF|nr:hypothetical protein PILCRDRAFT_824851 [Piloderma croceum F 1598]
MSPDLVFYSLHVVNAIGLPSVLSGKSPNAYVKIKIDDFSVRTNVEKRSNDPVWNEEFQISIAKDLSSTLSIQAMHDGSLCHTSLGVASIRVRALAEKASASHDINLKLFKGKQERGAIVVRFKDITSTESAGAQPAEEGTDLISSAIQRAAKTTDAMKGYNGEIMDTVIAVKSSDMCGIILQYLDKLVSFGDSISQVHPYAKLAWDVLTIAHKAFKALQDRDDRIKTLLSTAIDMLGFLDEIKPLPKIRILQDTVSAMMKQIYECAVFVHTYGERSLIVRVIHDNLTSAEDDSIQRFTQEFNRLRSSFSDSTNIQTWIVVHNVENNVAQLTSTLETLKDLGERIYSLNLLIPFFKVCNLAENERRLKELPGADLKGVRFDEDHACLRGTRQQLLRDIHVWVQSSDINDPSKRILWLSGQAGSGKSSVANSIAMLFDGLNRLGACFRFKRDTAGLNSPDGLFGNLCYQLSHFNKRLRCETLNMIDAMGNIGSSSLQTQAKKLLVDTTKGAGLVGPIVVVIDALDESGSKALRKPLLLAIAAQLAQLPSSIRVIITSRDEADIRASLATCADELCIDRAERTAEDIAYYIDHRIEATKRQYSYLPRDWPPADKIQDMYRRAGSIFIWASVACNFIEGFEDDCDPVIQLNLLLDVTKPGKREAAFPLKALDELYDGILSNAYPGKTSDNFHYVAGSIVAVKNPLTSIALDQLLGLGPDLAEHPLTLPGGWLIRLSSSALIISQIRPMLSMYPTGSNGREGVIQLLHPSLFDFLTGRADERFRIDLSIQNSLLALRCFATMNRDLKLDICKITNSSILNEEVENLPQRIDSSISPALRYACRFFAEHLIEVRDPEVLLTIALDEFVSLHLLQWIEAMSLLNQVTEAEASLNILANWLKELTSQNIKIVTIVNEAITFLIAFGRVIRLSALHTYISALSFTPKWSEIYQTFSPISPPKPENTTSSHPWWNASARVLEGHTDFISHITFSPCGKKLASSSHDQTIGVWDVATGQAIGPPLARQNGSVTYVEFSPDGEKLVSLGSDGMVLLWDVDSHSVAFTYTSRPSYVWLVAFLPDGKKIASASGNKTIRLWEAGTGEAIGYALEGHTRNITDIVLSPDGTKLASASKDTTVRLWNVENGQEIGSPLEGHTDTVACVSFSPDGRQIASGSFDGSVQLWDVETGHKVGLPLKSPNNTSDWITVRRQDWVAWSPDGKMLASAPCSATITIWEADTGNEIARVATGHSSYIQSLVFSPEGKRIASISNDHVGLWNAENGEAIGSRVADAAGANSVRFSPDGKVLAVSSYKTIKLWDIGAPHGNKFTHSSPDQHVDTVVSYCDSVTFSPNGLIAVSITRGSYVMRGDDPPTDNVIRTVQLWDVETGQAIRPGVPIECSTDSSWSQAKFSPNGKKLASSADSQTVQLMDVGTGCHKSILKQHWAVQLQFTPDSGKLASLSIDDKTVRLWDAESGDAVGPVLITTDAIQSFQFSPEGDKLITITKEDTVQLWDAQTGYQIQLIVCNYFGGPKDNVFDPPLRPQVAFSPDGRSLAIESRIRYDQFETHIVILWDIKGGREIGLSSRRAYNNINDLRFSLDGKRLVCRASAPDSPKARVWNLETGEVQTLSHLDSASLADFQLSLDTLSIDDLGFLNCAGTRLLWLPLVLRGAKITSHKSVVLLGGSIGMTFIRWAAQYDLDSPEITRLGFC